MIFKKGIKAVKAALGATVGPAVEDLKAKFAAGSIPLQTDFSNLIDIADCGRKSVGQSPAQDGSPGQGIVLDATGKAAVKVKSNGGLAVDVDGVFFDFSSAFRSGAIILFYSGNAIPDGWAICDGNNNTPNLVGRFVVGDSSNSDRYSISTLPVGGELIGSAGSVVESIAINSTALTRDQLPDLELDIICKWDNGRLAGDVGVGSSESVMFHIPTVYYDSSGDTFKWTAVTPTNQQHGNGHTHSATAQPHSHDVSVAMPFYSLIYIMKL
ncbi:phage tail protein [Paraburkholderia sp. D15]|uniref:hypothetical protein n=1 Tax=Paraburkholderia sp. D15 TaxID=2880218 RepID=UPI00247ABAC1|nr:hypothetical protein [Paraburkholderia sp. D15]WGS53951.1 phage tail protein [Paraburkholderia sp. D15]